MATAQAGDGTVIYYETWGRGEPLLLLSGRGCSTQDLRAPFWREGRERAALQVLFEGIGVHDWISL